MNKQFYSSAFPVCSCVVGFSISNTSSSTSTVPLLQSYTELSDFVTNFLNHVLCSARYFSPFEIVCTTFKSSPCGLDMSSPPPQCSKMAHKYPVSCSIAEAAVSHTCQRKFLAMPSQGFFSARNFTTAPTQVSRLPTTQWTHTRAC